MLRAGFDKLRTYPEFTEVANGLFSHILKNRSCPSCEGSKHT